jgi:hypothetical protein
LSERSFARINEMHVGSWKVEPVRVDDGGRVHGFVRVPTAKVLSIWAGGEKLFEVTDVDFAATQLVVALLPLPRVELQVQLRFEPERAVQPEVELAITDPSGHASDMSRIVARRTTGAFCGLPVPSQFAGRDCGLLVRCEGCAPYYGVVAIPADGTKATHDVVLSPPAFALRGVVVGPDGAPVPKASLQLVDTDGRWFLPPNLARRSAALDGTFAIADLPRRRVRLLVAADGCACRGLDVDAGAAEPLRIELRAPRKVKVRFPSQLDGAHVRVLDRDGRVVLDDRLSGTMAFGGGTFPFDDDAASIEVFDGASGQVTATGPITSEEKVALTPREAAK